MGPCLCGDPYCPHCGNPYLAELEAAEEAALEKMAKAKLCAEEYDTVVEVGLKAIEQQRMAILCAYDAWKADQAEREFEDKEFKYFPLTDSE